MKIAVNNITFSYLDNYLFQNLSYNFSENSWTCIFGQSGVGKTSLLRILAGLEQQESGTVSADFNDIAFITHEDTLLPWLTVLENIFLGYQLRRQKMPDSNYARSLLSEADLAGQENNYPHQLSKGMRQRVALIRTLVEDKSIILMDEPFSSLDAINRMQLHQLTKRLLKNKTVIFVSHDPVEAIKLADKILVMKHNPASLVEYSPTSDKDLVEQLL